VIQAGLQVKCEIQAGDPKNTRQGVANHHSAAVRSVSVQCEYCVCTGRSRRAATNSIICVVQQCCALCGIRFMMYLLLSTTSKYTLRIAKIVWI